jgi:hypothetical protein
MSVDLGAMSPDEMLSTLRRVQALRNTWAGPEGWADVESDRQFDSGYKTCWRERTEELDAALGMPS